MVSIGGMERYLYAFHRYSSRLEKTAFVGIHTGHLGFYADWMPEEIEKLVIALPRLPIRLLNILCLKLLFRYQHGGQGNTYLALNESTVKGVEGDTCDGCRDSWTAF